MRRGLRALLLAGAVALPLAAQAQTSIVADVGARGLGTSVATAGNVTTIDGGALAGRNLFHSFSTFSVGQGDLARWTRSAGDAGAISNVINRVTGGDVSRISGTIDSTALPNASFFFINPAGIVFSQGAQLNVPAAAFFSTAGELRFADGGRFAVAAPNGSTLSVAAPESFGFVGGQGAIVADGLTQAFSAAPFNLALTLAGSDVRMTNSSVTLRGLEVVGVGSGASTTALAEPSSGAAGGTVDITDTDVILTTSGGAGRGASISADRVTLFNTTLVSLAEAGRNGADITIAGNLLDLAEAIVTTEVRGEAPGAPGDVVLLGDRIFLAGGAFGSSPGVDSNSGDLIIVADTSLEALGTILVTETFTAGAAGSIFIQSPDVFLSDSTVTSSAVAAGAAGTVVIRGDTLVFDETSIEAEASGAAGAGTGLILLDATGDLVLFNSNVTSSVSGAATGGAVLIQGADVRLEQSIVQADTFGDGDSGVVTVTADNLLITNTAISSDTTAAGDAIGVTLNADTITLDFGAKVSSDSLGATGNAGAVVVTGGELMLLDGSSITSKADDSFGDAGAIAIDVDDLYLEASSISSDTNSFGEAGSIFISTRDLTLEGRRSVGTFISSDTLGDGDAGGVVIEATGDILVREDAFISSNAFGDGAAGTVSIEARSLAVSDGAFVASDTQGFGDAGDVSITVDNLLLEGGGREITYISSDTLGDGDAGSVSIDAKRLTVTDGAFISSDSYASGEGGDVTIRADRIELRDGGSLRSGTFGFGDAGNVDVVADTVLATSESAITSEAFQGSEGLAGFVEVTAGRVTVSDGARISTSTRGAGDAGAVILEVGELTVDGGRITSGAEDEATGAARLLAIGADRVSVINGGEISTVSANPQKAGEIVIGAGSVLIDGEGSQIASANTSAQPGAAGSIALETDDLTISDGGRISTNSAAGAAGDILIAMSETGFLRLEGAILPGSIETSSGADTGGKINISAPLAIISDGGSILALGDRQGANVVIESRYFINSADRLNTVAVDGEFRLVAGLYDVSSGTVNRNLSVVDASKVLRGQCPVARSTGQVSQLVTRPVGPYAVEPLPAAPRGADAGGCP